MIFRRSLVRELTATAIGLFVVLLAILFTNLVLRLLARAAGGTVAPGGRARAAGLQRDVLLQHPAVGHAVPDRAADAVPLVSRQRDDRLVHLRPEPRPPCAAADPAGSRRRSWSRSSCCRCSCRRGPSSAGSNTSASSSRATSSSLITPGLFREFRRAKLVVFVESINTFDGTIRNVFLHSIEDGKDVDHGRAVGPPRGGAQRRPLHRARRRAPLRRQRRAPPSTGSIEFERLGRRIEPAEVARAADRRRKAIPTDVLLARRRPRSSAPSSSGGCRSRSRRWC